MNDFKPGLEGVVAFETEIAEPDREGGSLRYRGVDIEELVGSYRFEQVWGLLVDETLRARPAGGRAVRRRRPDGQHAGRPAGGHGARRRRVGSPEADRHLRRRGARGPAAPLGAVHLDRRAVGADRRRRDRPDRAADGGAGRVDGRAVPARVARRGRSRSTCRRSTRTGSAPPSTASTPPRSPRASSPRPGADCAAALSSAVGALSGPLHGGAPARVLPMLDAAAEAGDAERYVERPARARRAADGLRPPRLPRRGSSRPAARAAPPRSSARRATTSRRSSSRRRSRRCARSRPTARSRRTSSSGRRSCSTSPTSRRRSRPRCSRARARPAGRRTSSSRRSSAASSGRRRATSVPARAPASSIG